MTATEKSVPEHKSTMSIKVTLEDVNDQSPVFEMDPYSAEIAEGSPAGTNVIKVAATDADTLLEIGNASIRY